MEFKFLDLNINARQYLDFVNLDFIFQTIFFYFKFYIFFLFQILHTLKYY